MSDIQLVPQTIRLSVQPLSVCLAVCVSSTRTSFLLTPDWFVSCGDGTPEKPARRYTNARPPAAQGYTSGGVSPRDRLHAIQQPYHDGWHVATPPPTPHPPWLRASIVVSMKGRGQVPRRSSSGKELSDRPYLWLNHWVLFAIPPLWLRSFHSGAGGGVVSRIIFLAGGGA